MALRKFQIILISAWLTVLVLLAATTVWLGVDVSRATQVLLVIAAIVPPTLALIVFRGPTPRSVKQMLYDHEHPPTSGGTR
jgi:hypothetical protein